MISSPGLPPVLGWRAACFTDRVKWAIIGVAPCILRQSGKDRVRMLVERFVSETPGVNGGYPVVAGTRTPIRTLVEFVRQGADEAELARLLPHLAPEAIHGALDY